MSNGVCILAQNNSTTDYVRQAYALAVSILVHNPNTNVSLITNDTIPSDYKDVFDKVIPIPWGDLAWQDWKIENRWKLYHTTPYRNTLVFDADMLVLENIDYIWNSNNTNLNFTSNVKTFRNENATSRYYRKTFDQNNLPNVYTAMYSFSKCDEVKEFFILLELIIKNWKIFYKKFASKHMQNWCSIDLSAAIAVKILNRQGYYLNNEGYELTHLKSKMQNFKNPPQKCSQSLHLDFGKNDLLIGGYKQNGILHYVEDEYLTDDLIKWLEEKI